jgi:rubrerythrin
MPIIDPNLPPVDILRMALEKEKAAFEFYTEAAKISQNESTRSTLQEMADEEAEHIRKIEAALDRFFYPDN